MYSTPRRTPSWPHRPTLPCYSPSYQTLGDLFPTYDIIYLLSHDRLVVAPFGGFRSARRAHDCHVMFNSLCPFVPFLLPHEIGILLALSVSWLRRSTIWLKSTGLFWLGLFWLRLNNRKLCFALMLLGPALNSEVIICVRGCVWACECFMP